MRRDLAKYESLVVDGGSGLDMRDEAGWKLVTGDVFRAPYASRALATQVCEKGFVLVRVGALLVGRNHLGLWFCVTQAADVRNQLWKYCWHSCVLRQDKLYGCRRSIGV